MKFLHNPDIQCLDLGRNSLSLSGLWSFAVWLQLLAQLDPVLCQAVAPSTVRWLLSRRLTPGAAERAGSHLGSPGHPKSQNLSPGELCLGHTSLLLQPPQLLPRTPPRSGISALISQALPRNNFVLLIPKSEKEKI